MNQEFVRYSRQLAFSGIGEDGQQALQAARVALVGCGADGSCIADRLVRAGVGHLALIDPDVVEISNLQRQVLYDEDDATNRRPKALAAAGKLKRINSQVEVVPRVTRLDAGNAEELLQGYDLVMDGSDNFQTRYLINDVCVKYGIPWVYCAVAGSCGTTMTILPHQTPCLRCLFGETVQDESGVTCNTVGITNPVVAVVAGMAAAEGQKVLVDKGVHNGGMLHFDVWENTFVSVAYGAPSPDCPACGLGRYDFLGVR